MPDNHNFLFDETDILWFHISLVIFNNTKIFEHNWPLVKLDVIILDDIRHTYMQCVVSGKLNSYEAKSYFNIKRSRGGMISTHGNMLS